MLAVKELAVLTDPGFKKVLKRRRMYSIRKGDKIKLTTHFTKLSLTRTRVHKLRFYRKHHRIVAYFSAQFTIIIKFPNAFFTSVTNNLSTILFNGYRQKITQSYPKYLKSPDEAHA